MDPADALFARLALARGWISREDHDDVMARLGELQALGIAKSAEDLFRESRLLHEGRLRVLRRLLSRFSSQARIGDYMIERRIGAGGTGMVFEARHRRLGRRVAVKVLFPRLEKERGFSERFLGEARVLARVNHANVVHAYDAGRDGLFYYVVTEMVEGTDLAQIIRDQKRLPIDRTLEICHCLGHALDAVHSAGLLHRDVKPANVLVATDGTIKLADLGLHLSAADHEVSWKGLVFGTPQYMSPEQVRGERSIDRRSDLYSLGATWYHMLTGRPLFPDREAAAVARAQLEEDPRPPAELRPDLPPALEALLLRLLKKDPADRPASAIELVHSLEVHAPWLARSPRSASRSAPSPRESSRRKPGALRVVERWLAVGLAGLLLVVATAFWIAENFSAGSGEEAPGVRTEPPIRVGSPRPPPPVEPAPPAATPRLPRESWRGALASVREGWEETRDGIASVLRRAVPDLGALIASVGPAPVGPPPAPTLPTLPEPVARWARQNATDARGRFHRRLTAASELPGGLLCPVRRGDVTELVRVRVRQAGDRVELFEESGQTVPMETVHPAMVIAWATLGEGGPGSAELAIACALDLERVDLARRLFHELRPELPSAIDTFLSSTEVSAAAPTLDEGRVDDYFDRAVGVASGIAAATRALEGGDWRAASEGFESLIERSEREDYLFPNRGLWEERRERSRELFWLTGRFFHTEVRATEPLRSATITLSYPLRDRGELDDFRFRPGGWTFRPGRILNRRREREVLDTVAVFSSPFTVEGEWSPGSDRGRLLVGFGDLGFGIGGVGAPLSVFRLGSVGQDEFQLRAAESGGGTFAITVVEDRVEARLPDGVTIETGLGLSAPRYGRISFALESRAHLGRLRITGSVYRAWTKRRIDLLESPEVPRN